MPILRWLKCEVGEGMFPDERTVRIALPEGGAHYAFVPASDVRMASASDQGHVRVTLIWATGGLWVLLPAENPNFVHVREVDLVA